jgi:hypothetical protein
MGEVGDVTTLALGEEGGGITDLMGEVGDVTTLALGEEGGEIFGVLNDIITGSGNVNIFTAAGDLIGNEHLNSGQF